MIHPEICLKRVDTRRKDLLAARLGGGSNLPSRECGEHRRHCLGRTGTGATVELGPSLPVGPR